MLRPLLLAILGAALLCAFFGVPQQPLLAYTGGMQTHTPKQPQMDVPPAVSSLTASQLQTVSLFAEWAGDSLQAIHERSVHTLPAAALSLRESIQASTILRI